MENLLPFDVSYNEGGRFKMFILLITINLIIILLSITFGVYGLIIEEFMLSVSAFSVIAAAISGLVATMVLKSNKDKERPYLTIKPNYNRYGIIQISVENIGKEIATIQDVKADNNIKLIRGEDFFEQIKNTVISPGDSINFILLNLTNYSELSSEYTTKGTITYIDINNKQYNNEFVFSIENLGPSPYHDDEKTKAFYEIQNISKEMKDITKELGDIRKRL